MRFFDCNCSFGEISHRAFRYARSAGELEGEMDRFGIERALVYHSGQRFGLPSEYNKILADAIRGHNRLEPTWTLMPSQTGEQAECEELIALMQANGLRALWAFPDEHHYRLDSRTFGRLFETLTQRRIPLLVKQNIIAVGDLVAEFPDLIVVAMNQGPHSIERYLRPLLDEYPNLHLDTSYYIVDGLIEEFCRRYGHKRLLFGSGFPDNCSGGAFLRLLHADIDDVAKDAIASGNLERLLNQVQL